MAQTDHLQDLAVGVVQLHVLTVGGSGHALPAGLAVVLGLAGQRGQHSHDQGHQEAQGGQVDVAVDGEDLQHVAQQGEHSHGDHAGQSAADSAAGVEAGPDSAQAQQDGGGHQPAVGEGEQVGGAAGEQAENPGQNADEHHDPLGSLQSGLGISLGVDQALIDVAGSHGGSAQSGSGSGGDGGGHGADNHEGAQQGGEGGSNQAVSAGGSHSAGTIGGGKGVTQESTGIGAHDAQGDAEHHDQDDSGQDEGFAGHLLAAAVGYLHPVVVVAPHQSGGEADDEVQHGGIGGHGAGQGSTSEAGSPHVAAGPGGVDGVKPAVLLAEQDQRGGDDDHAQSHLEEVGQSGGPQTGNEGEGDDHQENHGHDHSGVPLGVAGDGVGAGHDVVGQDARHAHHGSDGHHGTDLTVVAHLQVLGQSLGTAAADEVGEQHGEQQQAADTVDDAPGERGSQTQLDGKAGSQSHGGAGKADGAHADHVDKGGDLAAGQDVVGRLTHPALADHAAAHQDSAEDHKQDQKYCVSHLNTHSPSLSSYTQGFAETDYSTIATTRAQPAEAALMLTGKQLTLKPVTGSWSRLVSFSMWQ